MSKKRIFISVETTEEEKESFSEAVRQEGKSVSDVIRDFMRDYAARRSLTKKDVDNTRRQLEDMGLRIEKIEKMVTTLSGELVS